MGSDTSPEPGAFVGQLAQYAREIQGEARAAIARGEFTRASALIGDAELLADDVHGLVDDMEWRELGELAKLAAQDARAGASPTARRVLAPPTSGIRIALAATLAMSLALTEC